MDDDATQIGVIITDSTQKITHVNPAFTDITGYSRSECVGRNCNFLQGKDTDLVAIKELRKSLRQNAVCRVAILNYTKKGTPFWNLLTVSPMLDESGSVSKYVGIQMVKEKSTSIALLPSSLGILLPPLLSLILLLLTLILLLLPLIFLSLMKNKPLSHSHSPKKILFFLLSK